MNDPEEKMDRAELWLQRIIPADEDSLSLLRGIPAKDWQYFAFWSVGFFKWSGHNIKRPQACIARDNFRKTIGDESLAKLYVETRLHTDLADKPTSFALRFLLKDSPDYSSYVFESLDAPDEDVELERLRRQFRHTHKEITSSLVDLFGYSHSKASREALYEPECIKISDMIKNMSSRQS